MVLKDTIDILKSRNCRHEDKQAAYTSLVSNLKSDAARMFEEQLKTFGSQLLKLLYRDMLDTDEKIVLNTLQVLRFCLEAELIRSTQKAESEQALKSLLQCGHKTSSADVIKQIFDCLSVQKFHPEVIFKEISLLLDSIEAMNNKIKALSVFAVEKIVYIFVRLEEQIGRSLGPSSPHWARLVFPGLVSASEDVRDKSLLLLENFKAELTNAQELSRHVMKALNAGLAKSLSGLMSTHEIYVLKTWSLIVQVTGKELHKGSTINSLLEIIEVGFKRSHLARHHAFISWRSLIDNFALDKSLIVDPKRIKLLLMVLKIDNAKAEHVAVEKLLTWWHFCLCIGPKLSVNFELIVHPLLQFCVGAGKQQLIPDFGQSPKLVLMASAANSPVGPNLPPSAQKRQVPIFPAVQKLGCEVLGHLVSKVETSEDPGKIVWTLAPLSDEVFGSPTIFIKHAPIIMSSLHVLLKSVGNNIEENLVLYIWISVANHLRVAMASPLKTECRDTFSAFLNILRSIVQDELLQTHVVQKMIHICCGFPQKVLASTAYNITGGQTVRGCPAQLLIEVLLTPYVINNTDTYEKITKLFSTLVYAGASNVQGALLFLQTVTEMLDAQATCFTSDEILCRLWSTLAHTLLDTVSVTNEVNQGDALEYNFGCIYAVLLLPVRQQLPRKLSKIACKALLKTWKELYHSFARLSALVATAEANTCIEEMSAKINQLWNQEYRNPVNLEFVSTLCQKMIECVDFSAVCVTQNPGSGLTLSPSKWVRRRQRPLGNLHSFVHLLATVQSDSNVALSDIDDAGITKKQESDVTSLILVAHTLVEVYTKLFIHITSASVISHCLAVLARPLARFYQPNTKPGSKKLFVASFLNKLDKLWLEIGQCITGRYNGQYDSELLEHLSPLLEMTFLHSRRTIKNQALTLWNITFGRTTMLEYPSSLKHILLKMREKNAIIVPGLISNDEAAVIGETPYSDVTVEDSQMPAPVVATLPSPKRLKGSHLNRDLSPKGKHHPKPSPVKLIFPVVARNLYTGARKLVDIDLFPKRDFVVIESPADKKKRPLTEHQKEVLKQKRVLPAMYSNVEASQDISLMSQFGSESQQSVSSADVIVINSSASQEQSSQQPKTGESLEDHVEIDGHTAAQPSTLDSSCRRRSVRIMELHTCSSEINSRESVLTCEAEFSRKTYSDKVSKNDDMKKRSTVLKHSERDTSKNQGERLVSTSETDSCVSDSVAVGDDGSSKQSLQSVTDLVKMDAPFEMFRQAKVSLSQESLSTKSPRRISLRRVRSQDETTNVTVNSTLEKASFPTGVRTPRRVPLKKINEQECDVKSSSSPSGEKLQGCSISKEDQQIVLGEEHNTSESEQAKSSTSIASEVEQNAENKTVANVSSILVEDTQSPFKVKQHAKETDQSVAETPVKCENSNSPPVRATSARKLFTDYDIEANSQISRADLNQVDEGTNDQGEQIASEPFPTEIPELTSSQGFETTKDMNIQSTVEQQRILESVQSEDQKECSEGSQCKLDTNSIIQPESENLFPSAEEQELSRHSLDMMSLDMMSLDMMMPTVPSSVDEMSLNNSGKGSSNSSTTDNSKTSSSSCELSAKQSSSSESDFVCAQPTLTDEAVKYTPNKRKRRTPKRLCHENSKKGKKGYKFNKACAECESFAKVKCKMNVKNKRDTKSCLCWSGSSESDQSKHVSSPQLEETDSSLKPFHKTQVSAVEQLDSFSSNLAPVVSGTDVHDSEMVFTEMKVSHSVLQKIGEITPESSPKTNPDRGHSTVKRLGRSQKRKLANVDVSESVASKKITVVSSNSDNVNVTSKMEITMVREADEIKNKIKSLSPFAKKTSSLSASVILGRRKRILKRNGRLTKSQQSHCQGSALRKRKRVIQGNADFSDEDIKPLSDYQKKRKEDNCSSSDKNHGNTDLSDEDNKPLSNYQKKHKEDSCNSPDRNHGNADLSNEDSEPLPDYQKKHKEDSCNSPDRNHGNADLSNEDSQPLSDYQKKHEDSCNSPDRNHGNADLSNEDSQPLSDYQKKHKEDSCNSSDKNHDSLDINDIPASYSPKSAHAEESLEKSEIVDLTKSDSCDMETDSSASQQLISESSAHNASEISHSLSQHIGKDTEQETISVELSATNNSTTVSPDQLQAEQQVICLSPEGEDQELSGITNIPEFGVASVCSETAGNVETALLPKMGEGCEPEKQVQLQESTETESLECDATGESLLVRISQHDESAVKCSDLESGAECNDNRSLDKDMNKEDENAKADIAADSPAQAEDCTRESSTGIVIQADGQVSPEKNVAIVYDWSPHRSPGCSILKRCTETPPSGKSRRVSFAEPVVSGESPVREHCKAFVQTSPMISPKTSSPGQKSLFFTRSQRIGYRRRLDSSAKQEPCWSRLSRKIVSPRSQSSYRPTQESQLDNSGPVFPELVACAKPLDDILPQLTSSLWYRGLCQLMKGRNINTIGDLCSLTEVQIDQLPIRHPKVGSVKSTLNAYMSQHRLAKTGDSIEELPDGCKSPRSRGSTIEPEVTPANIDDEGIPVNATADQDLEELSPIQESPDIYPAPAHSEASSSSQEANEEGIIVDSATQNKKPSQFLSSLLDVAKCPASDLKQASLSELFDIHQTLNLLFTNVVEEMKARQSSM